MTSCAPAVEALPGWGRVEPARAAASRRAAEDVVLFSPRTRAWLTNALNWTTDPARAGVWFRAEAERVCREVPQLEIWPASSREPLPGRRHGN